MNSIILDTEEDCVLNTSTPQRNIRIGLGADVTRNPRNNNNFKTMDKELENDDDDEDHLLIIRVNDGDLEGMSIDEEDDPAEIQSKPRMDSVSSPDKANRRKNKKHKKQKRHRKDKDEVEGGQTPEVPKEKEKEEEIEFGKRKRSMLSEDSQMEDSDGKIILNSGTWSNQMRDSHLLYDFVSTSNLPPGTVYSLGNYCPRLLAGRECEKGRCAWTHYMMPRDAAHQFTKILQFRYCSKSSSDIFFVI